MQVTVDLLPLTVSEGLLKALLANRVQEQSRSSVP
jgi:hypothetical protein